MEVVKIKQTCLACPSQWEGSLEDGRMFYARYRWGCLSIEVSKKPTINVYMAMGEDGDLIYNEELGDEYDGVLGQSELVSIMEASGFFFKNK